MKDESFVHRTKLQNNQLITFNEQKRNEHSKKPSLQNVFTKVSKIEYCFHKNLKDRIVFIHQMYSTIEYCFHERVFMWKGWNVKELEMAFSTDEKILRSWEESWGIYAVGERVTLGSTCPRTNGKPVVPLPENGGSAQREAPQQVARRLYSNSR